MRLADEAGLEPEAVDACMKLGAGHPMGPLALLDFVGLDVAVAIGEQIGAEVPLRVRELIDAGRLGANRAPASTNIENRHPRPTDSQGAACKSRMSPLGAVR